MAQKADTDQTSDRAVSRGGQNFGMVWEIGVHKRRGAGTEEGRGFQRILAVSALAADFRAHPELVKEFTAIVKEALEVAFDEEA